MESLDQDICELKAKVDREAGKFAVDLQKYLDSLKTPYDLARWIVTYDAFNRGFPGAGLQLAGRIGLQTNMFGDLPAEKIAAKVMAAISDEFIEGESKKTSLHSVTRRAFAKNAVKYLAEQARQRGVITDDTKLDKVFTDPGVDELRKRIIDLTTDGYGINEKDDLKGVFSGLGFFTGSETSGSVEFKVLGDYFDAKWPGLIASLRGVEDGQGKQVYDWVVAHKDLEADHAKFAFSAVRDAVENLDPEEDVESAIILVRTGFKNFFRTARKTLLNSQFSSDAFDNLFGIEKLRAH